MLRRGIFIPLLYIGACFGRVVGIWWQREEFITYAIVASVGMLAGVARVLISLTAIMMQTTVLPYLVTPFMIVTIFARVVGKKCFGRDGIYDVIVELKGIPFLEERPPSVAKRPELRASSIMTPTRMVTLKPKMQVSDIIGMLKAHSHDDFPVVDSSHGILIGTVAREHLLALLDHKGSFYSQESLENGSTNDCPSTKAIAYDELVSNYQHVPELETIESALTKEDLLKVVDLTEYAQLAPLSFNEHGSAERAYELFRTQGLRNLIVLNSESKLVGAITRQDLKILDTISVDDQKLQWAHEVMGTYTNIS